jgi:hypothetical protein
MTIGEDLIGRDEEIKIFTQIIEKMQHKKSENRKPHLHKAVSYKSLNASQDKDKNVVVIGT